MTPRPPTVVLEAPDDLGAAELLAVADGARVQLSQRLLDQAARHRTAVIAALASAGPVYGVNTGMGRLSHVAVDAAEQAGYQDDLMLARAVGSAPWLDHRTVRAVVAARLRTLLGPEVGVSPNLLRALQAVLDADLHPALPATGNGAAGEIIPLAHLGGFLTGSGEGLDAEGTQLPAAEVLHGAGLTPYSFAAKEGVAFLQGTPVALADAALLADELRVLASQSLTAAAGTIACVRAPRDPYDAALARGDDQLAAVLDALRGLAGQEPEPRVLQAPVSFRVVGPALAHLLRATEHLEAAVDRGLSAVSTSPALVEDRFLGTAGFHGVDVATAADACRVALLHVAETTTARLHRMLDPAMTGLPAQLSAEPGRQAGLVALHKRAAGLVHQARRHSAPAVLGSIETSLGQEDVQSFALEATRAAHQAADVLRDVTACELLAVHQATKLDASVPTGTERLEMVLHKAFEGITLDATDRPLGREVTALRGLLGVGWAHDVLLSPAAAAPRPPLAP